MLAPDALALTGKYPTPAAVTVPLKLSIDTLIELLMPLVGAGVSSSTCGSDGVGCWMTPLVPLPGGTTTIPPPLPASPPPCAGGGTGSGTPEDGGVGSGVVCPSP